MEFSEIALFGSLGGRMLTAALAGSAVGPLERRGYRTLVRLKKEPWGQTVSRFLSPEGLPVAVTFTPAVRSAPSVEAPGALADGAVFDQSSA